MVFLVALICSGFTREETWVIDPTSRLAIHGETNINSFTCQLLSYAGNDTLRYFNNPIQSEFVFTTNRMSIPVKSFNCGAKQISKDFWATLKSDQYPQLEIRFISLASTTTGNDSYVKGTVDITLAGVTARYGINFIMDTKGKYIHLAGEHPVNFSDFRLKAPEKLNGLIRVNQVLHVEFNLVLKPITAFGVRHF